MNAEQQMKEALDGKFVSFRNTDYGMQFFEKNVSVNFRPHYSSIDANINGAKLGDAARKLALARAKRSASFWTTALLDELIKRREAGTGSNKISKEMNIPRGEVLGQLKRMGLL